MNQIDPLNNLVVEIDIPVTRRMKLHAVVAPTGEQIFHSKRICEIFQWLLDNEVQEFTMLDEDTEFRVSLSPPDPPSPKSKG